LRWGLWFGESPVVCIGQRRSGGLEPIFYKLEEGRLIVCMFLMMVLRVGWQSENFTYVFVVA